MAYTIYEGPTGRERLLQTFEKTDPGCFDDLLHCCAVTVEDALLQAGMKPIKDYKKMDLFKMAMPVAIEYSAKFDAAITTGIPDSHPHSGSVKRQFTVTERRENGKLVREKTHIAS